MMIKTLVIILIVIVIVVAALLSWGRWQWRQYVAKLSGQMLSEAQPVANGRVRLAETDTLPEPVKRYFHHVLQEGQSLIKTTRLHQEGGFRTSPDTKDWLPLRADQYFSTVPHAFVWDASITMLPGLSVDVCDSYRQGRGNMNGKILALFPVIKTAEDRRLNQAALQRWLAEAVWFPTALLPSQGIVWEAIDTTHANATLTDSEVSVALEFEFNDLGEIVSVYTPGRYREVEGDYVLAPWKGYFCDYIEVGGYRIPSQGKVEWHLKDQTYPYWRGEVRDVRYEY
jgi:hypothetical protein